MTDPADVLITVGLTPSADPVQGYLQDEKGVRCPFHGWLELAAALTEASARGGLAEWEGVARPAYLPGTPSRKSLS